MAAMGAAFILGADAYLTNTFPMTGAANVWVAVITVLAITIPAIALVIAYHVRCRRRLYQSERREAVAPSPHTLDEEAPMLPPAQYRDEACHMMMPAATFRNDEEQEERLARRMSTQQMDEASVFVHHGSEYMPRRYPRD